MRTISLALVLGLLGLAAPKAQAQMFVSSAVNGPVRSYDPITGESINASLIPNSTGPQFGLATAGNYLYVSDLTTFTVGLYDATTGATINASLIQTGGFTGGMLVSDNRLYFSENSSRTVGVYDALTGAVINASLIANVPTTYGMALSGNHLFVSHYGIGTVGVYDITTGATINASLVSGLNEPAGVAISGNNLYVASSGSGTIGVYDATTGATINASLISEIDLLWAIAFFNGMAQTSAETTGLPMANAEGQMLISATSTVTNDINGHLFNLRAGDGEEAADDSVAALIDEGVIAGQGDGNPDPKSPMARKVLRSRQWEVFTTVNYGNVKLNAINSQAGVQIDAWAPSVGIERHLSRGLAVGFATTFLTSDQNYTSGLGRLHLEGPALSAYVSYARKDFWSSLLYSFGTYQLDSRRNPGFGFPQAFGTTRTYTHSVQYNTGWNFRFQDNTFVTGPFAGIDYLHGSVDAYGETGGGLAALTYGRQTFQSLVTRVGWSATKKIQTSWAAITPQVRLSYERQNLTNNGTSVSLINAPFTASGGNQSPGQSYMVAGAGVNFQFTDQLGLLLSYQTQIFRDNLQAHFGSVRLSYKF